MGENPRPFRMAETDRTGTDVGKYLAGGGVSGAVVACVYMVYKLCKGRAIKSSCCGGEMSVGSNEHATYIVQSSPTIDPVAPGKRPPSITLEPHKENSNV